MAYSFENFVKHLFYGNDIEEVFIPQRTIKIPVQIKIVNKSKEPEDEPAFYGIPDIDKILFQGRATIVFWEDGTKTVARCMAGEKFDRYAGFAAACMKKMFGSTFDAKSLMECLTDDKSDAFSGIVQPRIKKKEEPAIAVGENHEAITEAVNEALNGLG